MGRLQDLLFNPNIEQKGIHLIIFKVWIHCGSKFSNIKSKTCTGITFNTLLVLLGQQHMFKLNCRSRNGNLSSFDPVKFPVTWIVSVVHVLLYPTYKARTPDTSILCWSNLHKYGCIGEWVRDVSYLVQWTLYSEVIECGRNLTSPSSIFIYFQVNSFEYFFKGAMEHAVPRELNLFPTFIKEWICKADQLVCYLQRNGREVFWINLA